MLFHFQINIHENSIKHDSIVGFIWQTLPNYHVPYNYITTLQTWKTVKIMKTIYFLFIL
jgi:hypothetical protein